jgi:hypothetical protein
LQRTAPFLFGDISLVLREYIPLQVCKLTDPEKDVHGNVSLTIEFFLNNSDFSGAPAKSFRLRELSGKIHAFRKHLKPARNKIVTHFDRKTAWAGKPLGGVDNDAWNDFWLDLQSFVGILCERYLGETLDINVGDTDAERLVQSLKRKSLE